MNGVIVATVLAFLARLAAALEVEIGFSMPTFSTQEGGPFRICLEPTAVTSPLSQESFVTLDRSYEIGKLLTITEEFKLYFLMHGAEV